MATEIMGAMGAAGAREAGQRAVAVTRTVLGLSVMRSSRMLIRSGHSARITDAALGALIVVRLKALSGAPMTWAQLAIAALVLLALFRRPLRRWGQDWLVPIFFSTLVVYTTVISLVHGISPWKRAAVFVLLMLFSAFIATGRVDVGSVVKGLAIGLAINSVLFFAHAAPDDYAGYLTGYLQDKNAAALYYAVGGLLLTMAIHRTRWKLVVLAATAAAVVLTGSRTSMAAGGAALVWLFVSQRLRRWAQVLLAALLAAAFIWANSTNYVTDALGRTTAQVGSDVLRSRIDAASTAKVDATSWLGRGLGEAQVNLDRGTWFFNSSYQGLYVEGGMLLVVCIIAIYAIYGFGLRVSRDPAWTGSWDTRVVSAATLMIFFCGTRLGEVWMSPIGFLVLGVAMANFFTFRDANLTTGVSSGTAIGA